MGEELVTGPKWNVQSTLSREAVETLWERAASYILEEEDAGNMRTNIAQVWRHLHQIHPDLYPASMPSTYNGWANNQDWLAYLSLRRQDHYIRTMPTRVQIKRYHAQLLDRAGAELVRRLHETPEAISDRELISLLKISTTAVAALEQDINIAQGAETNNQMQINVFQFLEKAPPERRDILAAAIAKRSMPDLSGGNGN